MTDLGPLSNDSGLSPIEANAYNACLNFQHNAGDDEQRMHARVLGYLLLHAPSITARAEVAKEIDSCNQDQATLSKLGKYFIDHYIRAFKKSKHTPVPSDYSSRSSFDEDEISVMASIEETPKTHKEAKRQALIRDSLKCVVTGLYDADASKEAGIPDATMDGPGFAVHTECAHIVPESTCFNVSNTPMSVLAVLKHFGLNIENSNGEKFYHLNNVMTMQHDEHDRFDYLETYFKATSRTTILSNLSTILTGG